MHGSKSYVLRTTSAVIASAAALAICPTGTAGADDGTHSPATPIIRATERGSAMSGGNATLRPGTQIDDARNHRVVVEGGETSKGAPIMVQRGNPASLPIVQADDVVVCSARQRVVSKMIQCSR